MLSYKDHFASQRADGRHVSTVAATMAMLRDLQPELALPKDLAAEDFPKWQAAVIERHRQLLCLPEATPQPEPKMLSCVQRDGYRVEKWEFYPDDYSAVPFLALIPDGADKDHPVPGVMCLPGTNHSKEFLAGEPLIAHPNCTPGRFPERNHMAQHIVKAGMAAFAFDNPGFGECSVLTDPAYGETQFKTVPMMANAYLGLGRNYFTVTVFQKLRFMEHLRKLPYIDRQRIGVSAHSLGTGHAISLGLLCGDIKAVVFNDFLCDELRRLVSITEHPGDTVFSMYGSMQIIPGLLQSYSFQDLCAAFAPRYLAINEGGADELTGTVQRGFRLCGAEDRLQITYYPKYADPEDRKFHGDVPKEGLTFDQFYRDHHYVDVEDHSFRPEPSIRLLKKAFGMK